MKIEAFFNMYRRHLRYNSFIYALSVKPITEVFPGFSLDFSGVRHQ